MTLSKWLDQAKDGDAGAIAALLNQSLQPQGITVRAERESYCLNLWVSGATLPPQDPLVDHLRRAIERLQVDSIGILRIEAEADAAPAWTVEMALLAGVVQGGDRGEEPGIGGEKAGIGDLPSGVVRAYRELRLSPGASLADIEAVYFKTKAALLRQGRRADLEPLKWAFDTLRDYLETQSHSPVPLRPTDTTDDSPPGLTADLGGIGLNGVGLDGMALGGGDGAAFSGAPPLEVPPTATQRPGQGGPWLDAATDPVPDLDPAQGLQAMLQDRGLPAQVFLRADQLYIRWPAVRVANPKQASAQIYTLLAQKDLVALGLGEVSTLVVAALNSRNQVVWRQSLAMPQRPTVEEDTDLMSFNNRYSNGIIFPVLLASGILLNAMPIANALLQGIKIWIHEFGHATVAWLAGRQAIPLPIGWTNVNPQRSVLVYFGVLMLLGLLYWSGQKEGKQWPINLAVGLALLQFAMTWLMSPTTFDMLLAFGGVGGELYLSALLMVSFFFPLPAYWRWDFYRYPIVLGAAFTFWGQFWLWKRIRMGRASIPFGGLWGDPDHGDMNILANRHNWEPGRIIGTYNTIANLCLLTLLGVYAYVLYRQHRHRLWLWRQRWLG